jgi:cyclophilin family peptidyl-prolyl cis-trans isomerase
MELNGGYKIALLIMLALGTLLSASCTSQAPVAKPKTYSAPPPLVIDTSKDYTATIETEKGNLVLQLFASDVPITVNNFVFLAREGFYDGSTFHRVIPGFMAQGGDPTGTGRGNPGYTFADEFTGHTHVAGALSMANSGANTNGCQFFITYTPQPGLDGKHTVFGQLVAGMDVLESLTPRDPSQNPDFEGDRIIRITITES